MKYWAYMKGEVPGSYEPEALAALPEFSMTTLVCPAQGEIAEKNWRHAGEFEDIAKAIASRDASRPPAAPAPAAAVALPAGINEVDALLDTASTRLFSHVAELMKELENRRDEKSLVASLQRQISALKQELIQAREQVSLLEIRMPHVAALEESQRKEHADLVELQNTLCARDAQIGEQRASLEKMRAELTTSKQRQQETSNDLAIRNRLIDKLSQELSEKELSLAKSLGVIRRLEEDLNRLCPSEQLLRSAAAADELPCAPDPKAEPRTDDDPPPPPAPLEPRFTEGPKAHEALKGFFKKVFPGQTH